MPPGNLINIGSHYLHAHTMGSGDPPVVFESALGAFGLQWFRIQSSISEMTQTISYDRAGQGWSDFSPHPRTPKQVTDELKLLLKELNISSPFILVAHSFGGLIARYYANSYPDDVIGLVLVDTSHEMQYEKIKNFSKLRKTMNIMLTALSVISNIRFLGNAFARISLKEIQPYIPKDVWNKLLYVSSTPKHHRTVKLEFGEFERYFGQTSEIPNDFGDLPLTVVVAEQSLLKQRPIGGFTAEELNNEHHIAQKALTTMSRRSEYVVVPSATHLSIVCNPVHCEYVIDAIKDMLERVGK